MTSHDMDQPAPRALAKCPICKGETQARWRPFCSKRCADVDLGRWMTGHYAIPDENAELPDAED